MTVQQMKVVVFGAVNEVLQKVFTSIKSNIY